MPSTDIPQRPTLRQLYDFVVERIVEQGRPSVNDKGVCLYRAPNGTKCAIGMVIADAHFEPFMEEVALRAGPHGRGEYALFTAVERSLGFELLPSAHVALLNALQEAHDGAAVRYHIRGEDFLEGFREGCPPRPQE